MASAGQPGFYLIMAMGSEQAGLTQGILRPEGSGGPFHFLSSKLAYSNQKRAGAQSLVPAGIWEIAIA